MKTHHRITGAILAIAFATTTALPAAGIPQIKAPAAVKAPPSVPKAITPPKVPVVKVPVAPKVPVIPHVPVVKVPAVPKIPVVNVPTVPKIVSTPKIPVVKAPVVPKVPVVRTPSTPKIPVVKVPTAPKIPSIPKIPTVKTPRVPVIVKVPVTPKIPVVKTPAIAVLSKLPRTISTQATIKVPAPVKTPAVTHAPAIQFKPASKPSPLPSSGKNTAKGSDNTLASITSTAPPDTRMTAQGGSGGGENTSSKKTKQKDFSDIRNAYRRQKDSDDAKSGDSDPYFAGGGFNRDLFQRDERLVAAFENENIGASGLLGDQDDETPVSITRGRLKDLAEVIAAAQLTGLDEDDPVVTKVKDRISTGRGVDKADLERLKNEVANRGLDQAFGEAPAVSVKDLTERGDKLRDQGKLREAKELYEQAKDALKNGGKNTAKFRAGIIADVQLGFRPVNDLAIVSNPGTGAQNGGQPSSTAAKEPSTEKPASNVTTPADRVPFDPATGKAATRPSAEVSTPEVAATPAATAPGRDVSTTIDFSDIDFEPEAPTSSSLVPIEPADEFYGPDGAAEPGAKPAEGDDDILSPPPGNKENGNQTSNNNGESSGSDDDKDDKDDDNNTETPPATTETEEAPVETAETEDTPEASEEGTPNPEARDRNGYTGRLADHTGGRVGGDEQRRQGKALDQRKNGNGAGGPNPEGNTHSGVLLTPEEQSAFAKNLGMKRGGGVTTPTEDASSATITDRDLKDIAARRGSTINPAGGIGKKGGSGLNFGKKGFTPGAGAPAPAPKGAQVNGAVLNNAVQAAPAAKAVRGAAIRVDTVKIQPNAR